MPTDQLMGLFGPSAYDVEQARNKQALDYAVQMANMNNIQQAKFGIGQGAAGLANATAGMFGLVDPKVEEAKRTQAIMAQGGDLTTSKGLKEKAAQFAQAGDQTTALKLMLLARKQEQEEAKMLIEQRKQILAERKQEDVETDARELKKMQIMATIRQADERIADKRTSEADRVAAMRERTEAMLLLGKMANALKAGQQQTKAPTGLTREARLIWELENGLIDPETYKEAMAATPGGKAKAESEKAVKSARDFLAEAGYDEKTGTDTISGLIKKSTSGRAEALGAEVASWANVTTEGRKALNTLASKANRITMALMGGKLGAGISNTDREFVLGQLGDVANANKTSGERLAAWTAAIERMKEVAGTSNVTHSTQTEAPQGVDPRVWAVMTPEEKALWKK